MTDFTNVNKLFMDFAVKNDYDSFDKLYRQTSPWLYRCIYRIVASREVAEDILQESWMIMIENKHVFNPDKGKFSNLIFTVSKNLAFKEVLKKKDGLFIKNSQLVEESISKDKTPEEIYSILERSNIISSSIAKLKKEYQDVILLYYYCELSIKEISQHLVVPENTVKTIMVRARKQIELMLTKENNLDWNSLLNLIMILKP